MNPTSRSYLRPRDSSGLRAELLGQGKNVGSWTALVAATALGVPSASKVHAEVRADTKLSSGRDYRLVVQSFDETGMGAALAGRARPIGSLQRAVTADELRRGVQVDLLELRQSADRADASPRGERDDAARGELVKALVLAWVEEGKPDLPFDARRAHPQPGSFVGGARRAMSQESVVISVKPRVAG